MRSASSLGRTVLGSKDEMFVLDDREVDSRHICASSIKPIIGITAFFIQSYLGANWAVIESAKKYVM